MYVYIFLKNLEFLVLHVATCNRYFFTTVKKWKTRMVVAKRSAMP